MVRDDRFPVPETAAPFPAFDNTSRVDTSSLVAKPIAEYRPGVGMVLLNSEGRVFVGRRAYLFEEAWQMPQGGIEPGEHPREAAFRELREEIGTDDAQLLAESEKWLGYDVPPSLAPPSWGGRWQGQCQKWFAMRFSGVDAEINVATAHPEFDGWRWIPAADVPGLAVDFKRDVYRAVFSEFQTIFRDQ